MSYSRHTGRYWQRSQAAPKVPRIMTARKPGTCAQTGAAISPGDSILWDPIAGQAFCHGSGRYIEHAQGEQAAPAGRYISDVIRTSGGEFYRNKAGRCIDAPCCGCCTI